MQIFKIKREKEDRRYKPFKKLHNRKLLWHGSRLTNYVGILSQGKLFYNFFILLHARQQLTVIFNIIHKKLLCYFGNLVELLKFINKF